MNGGGASDEFFDLTGCAVRKPGVNMVDDHLADVRKLKDVLSDQRHRLAESRICRMLGKGGIGDCESQCSSPWNCGSAPISLWSAVVPVRDMPAMMMGLRIDGVRHSG